MLYYAYAHIADTLLIFAAGAMPMMLLLLSKAIWRDR